jgi:hypothetical protein
MARPELTVFVEAFAYLYGTISDWIDYALCRGLW